MSGKLTKDQKLTVIGLLKGYRGFKSFLETAPQRLKEMEDDVNGIAGAWYELLEEALRIGVSCFGSGTPGSPVESEAMSREKLIEEFKAKMQRAQLRVDMVEAGLRALPEDQRTVIEMFYIKCAPWKRIEAYFDKTEKTVQLWRDDALNTLHKAMFGGE